VSALVAFAVGFGIAYAFKSGKGSHTVTETTTVPSGGATGVPVACLQGIQLTRQIEHTIGRRELTQLQIEFETAVAQCRVAPGCIVALTFAPKILDEKSAPKLRVLSRQFEAAVKTCR
jgi:hypothetical protein